MPSASVLHAVGREPDRVFAFGRRCVQRCRHPTIAPWFASRDENLEISGYRLVASASGRNRLRIDQAERGHDNPIAGYPYWNKILSPASSKALAMGGQQIEHDGYIAILRHPSNQRCEVVASPSLPEVKPRLHFELAKIEWHSTNLASCELGRGFVARIGANGAEVLSETSGLNRVLPLSAIRCRAGGHHRPFTRSARTRFFANR